MNIQHLIRNINIFTVIALIFVTSIFLNANAVYATETSMALPKISEIYPNAPGASELGAEFVELVNNSSRSIDMSSYQLQIKDKPTKTMPLAGQLLPYTYKAFITTFSLVNSGEVVQLVYAPSSQIVEEVAYSGSAAETESWSLFTEGWELAPVTKDAPNQRYIQNEPTSDVCPVTPEFDQTVPAGYEVNQQGACVLIQEQAIATCAVDISEISAQPNFNGNEYIELINNTTDVAALKLCKLSINGAAEKSLPESQLSPGQYFVYTASSGTIRNSAGSVTLIHSDNTELQYSYVNTNLGQTNNYEPGSLNAVVSDVPTPGEPNSATSYAEESVSTSNETGLADCGAGKYRNPETNRCKAVATDSSGLNECPAGQQRNPETNRCRKITLATASLTPCKTGQERNSDTNRCRAIGSTASSLKDCGPGQERNPETNRCRKSSNSALGSGLDSTAQASMPQAFKYKIPLIVLLATGLVGYGTYEYRTDLKNLHKRVKESITHGRPPS